MTDNNDIKENKVDAGVNVTEEMVAGLLPLRYQNSNKGTYGSVLNIAGCAFYPGAAFLSSIAALKIGAGLCTLATETAAINSVSSQTPDLTFINLGTSESSTIPRDASKYLKDLSSFRAISIGPGLSLMNPARDFVLNFLSKNVKSQTPIVIDADAINALSTAKNLPIPLNSVITPHPLELARLLNVDVARIQGDRVKWAMQACFELDCIVVLKGQNTVTAVPNGKVFINTTGNSALAKAGTGDVLTGMIAGLAAQGLKLEDAAVLGVYLHGRAGEIASQTLTEYGVLASNLIGYIPLTIRELLLKYYSV